MGDKIYKETAKYELPPAVSSSAAVLEYISNQSSVIDEIKTKMQMMQRERDKYEDMIEEELKKNKVVCLEVINMNMKITDLESTQMVKEQKCQEQTILHSTLSKELAAKLEDTDSKKIKGLKNTVFQFGAERDTIVQQVEETKSKLRLCTIREKECRNKCSQLNVELGELKILLDAMRKYDLDELESIGH